MGVFSELDLENQQTELDGHDSKTAEMQTLQAKLIQQHEQKKAAAAAEVSGHSSASSTASGTEASSINVNVLSKFTCVSVPSSRTSSSPTRPTFSA